MRDEAQVTPRFFLKKMLSVVLPHSFMSWMGFMTKWEKKADYHSPFKTDIFKYSRWSKDFHYLIIKPVKPDLSAFYRIPSGTQNRIHMNALKLFIWTWVLFVGKNEYILVYVMSEYSCRRRIELTGVCINNEFFFV